MHHMINEYQTINPTTGKVIASYPTLSQLQLDEKLNVIHRHQAAWQKVPLKQRSDCIRKIGQLLLDSGSEGAQLMTDEMGKTLSESLAEIKKCATLCNYYADHAEVFLAPKKINYDNLNAEQVLEPLGVIYTIMPWNFPFWQVLRGAIPTLLLGNAVILKHAENVIGCGYFLEKLIQQATQSTECEVFKNIVIDLSLSEFVIKHDAVVAVTLTGSNRAGSIVAKHAGEACKKSVLELGGSDPYIIRSDVNINDVAEKVTKARMVNAGQVCISPKRLIVDRQIKSAFEQAVVECVNQIKVGDPNDKASTMGPMARADLREHLHAQVMQSQREGARLLVGGEFINDKEGLFYAPTVLSDVTSSMTAFKEELFGPVMVIIESSSDEEAIELANQSQFGLGSGIFTQDIALAHHMARYDIQAGMCFINECVNSHPALPFGGIKQSGYGRECAEAALHELANAKTVLIA